MILLEAFAGRLGNQADAVQQLTDARERLVGLQGVAGVAVSSIDPLFARRMLPWTGFQPEGWTGGPIDRVTERRVSANFFDTMGISLVEGVRAAPVGGRRSHARRGGARWNAHPIPARSACRSDAGAAGGVMPRILSDALGRR